jgi:serine/threonine-protein kinase
MDFGIARAIDDLGATLTSTWNIVGTAQYLSPEQAQGSVADARSDLYSTGCLLYELLTGRPPFTGETPVSIALQHVSGQFPPARSIQPDLPADVETVLAVALSKSPDARYQDALSMLADLKRLRDGVQVTTKIARAHPFKRRSFIIAGVSVLIASLLAIVGLSVNGGSKPSVGFELPNVIGLTEDQARDALSEYVVTVTRAHDPRIPAGRIASQIPLASSDVPPGSGVVLTISDGPGDAIVPDGLVGLDLTDARAALAAVGLVVSQTIATSSNEPQGTVLEVTPLAGSTITAGSGVILTIANGEVEVPNLVGVEAIQAKTLLFNADFLIKEFYDYDPAQPIGVVIRQAPEAGTTQTIGNSVTITINRAP